MSSGSSAVDVVLVGVDGGTESIRVMCTTRQGHVLAAASAPYATSYPYPGWAEQQPDSWYSALCLAFKQAMQALTLDQVNAIKAICIDTTCCSVVALDASQEPVRPCLLWMDMRSGVEHTEKVLQTNDVALRVNSGGSGPVSAEWMVPKALWIKENEPSTWSQTAYLGEYQDFINLKLTGKWIASTNNTTVRWHWTRGNPPLSLLKALNLEDVVEKWPAEAIAPGEVVGNLTKGALHDLGLPQDAEIVVAQGGADAFIGMVGLNVLRPGELALITGSSHLHLGVTDSGTSSGEGVFGAYEDGLMPGVHVVEGGQTSTGSVVAWYRRLLGDGVSYDVLNEEAAAIPIGCDGLVCQEHFQGNRTPHTDALSRGAIVGLTLKHTRAHIYRSILEAVSFGTRLILETMRDKAGYRPTVIVVAGGVTRSPLWLQITADVVGVPLRLTKCTDAPSLGCAILAASAIRLYPSVTAAAESMVAVDRTIEPNMEAHRAYEPFYRAYVDTYQATRGVVAALRSTTAAQT